MADKGGIVMEKEIEDSELMLYKTAGISYNFKEKDDALLIINRVSTISNDDIALESDLEKLTSIFDKYQEQPHLMDPHLEEIVLSCIKIVRNENTHSTAFHQTFRYLYLVCKTRGAKCTLRFFTHEAADLQPVLNLLIQQNVCDYANWQTRYVLLLWLSFICMIPFDLVKFDGSKGNVIDSIMTISKMYISVSDKSRDAAANLLARFVSRPDVKKDELPKFFDWCLINLVNAEMSSSDGLNLTFGILTVLCHLFKCGKREDILEYADVVLSKVEAKDFLTANDILLKKLAIKLIQRLGMCFLKPKVASWRYQRGNRSLLHNLQNPSSHKDNPKKCDRDQDEIDESYDVPASIESVIQQLLIGLRDRDTVVRWSAAKGIGRISSRLPKDLANDVIGTVLEYFSPMETDNGWHGGCLALAELGKRGLLLPERLNQVVPIIVKALIFDEKLGKFCAGSHVRDAACYVCWSFARAYDPKELVKYISVIASSLIIVSVFDREVNCRRAASAAFQEHVGRQGKFPHGIDILTTVDYFSVGNIANCYLNLSVHVANFSEYTNALVDHLIYEKVSHWDSKIRDLSSKSLAKLTSVAAVYIKETGLPIFLAYTKSSDLNKRHGGILAIAEVTYALCQHLHSSDADFIFSKNVLESIKEIVPEGYVPQIVQILIAFVALHMLNSKDYFSGVEGDFMKVSVCKLIEKMSMSKAPFEFDFIVEYWQDVIDDCLPHTIPEIQEIATVALHEMCNCYYKDQNGHVKCDIQETLVRRYLAKLKNSLRFDRMGYALGLGVFPAFFISGKKDMIINGLLDATIIDAKNAGLYAESRVNAVKSLTRICTELGLSNHKVDEISIDEEDLLKIMECLLRCLQDYSTDRRGDVGAWVREAAMTGIEQICNLIVNNNLSLLNADMSEKIMMGLVQQSAEKIDRTRAHASEILHRMIHFNPEIPNVPQHKELQKILPRSEIGQINWAAPTIAFPKITELLNLQSYRKALMLGLIVSVGGLTESIVRSSSRSLLQYFQSIQNRNEDVDEFIAEFVEILKDNYKNDRVTIPLLNVFDLLISNGCFDSYLETPREGILERLLLLVINETNRSGDAKKLLHVIKIYCGLIQFPGEVRRKSLGQLMKMLCHKYPRVRREAASDLYTALITYEDIVGEDDMEQILTILSETEWDGTIDQLQNKRNDLCSLLEVPVPRIKMKNGNKQLKTKVDALESYQDLVTRDGF